MNSIATIIGTTGLIGGELLKLLQHNSYYSEIRVLTRRSIEVNDPKVKVVVVDFSNYDEFKNAIRGSSVVFCAIGTTMRKVKGNKAEYRKIDFDIAVNAAKYCSETGCEKYLIVSSVGANSKSNNFYLKLKGEVEDAIKLLSIPGIFVFRPSMLMGKRNESRLIERIAGLIIMPLAFLFPSHLKPIAAKQVARAMIIASMSGKKGFNVYQYNNIQELIGSKVN